MNANSLQTIVQEVFSRPPTQVHYLHSGINQTALVEMGHERCFVKWKTDAPPRFFEAESRGLVALRATGLIRVPEVIQYAERNGSRPAFLVMEWIDEERPSNPRQFAQNFGQALAQQHRITAPAFGLDHDNYIGELPQCNTQRPHWVDFYRDQRITRQMELARVNGHLPARREALLTRLMDRLNDLLSGITSVPSLLHGDLWSGNFLTIGGNLPVVVDPAVYYGEREVEMAFTELFGGFPMGFYAAYREAYPLDPGYEDRRALYQLYPLLVHLNIFGESYGGQVDAVCHRYVG